MSFGDAITDIELNPNKVLLHAAKLEQLARGEDVFPVTVELDLVDFCNHRCGWCVDPHHGRNRLEEELVSEILRELRELGAAGIVYKGGGEPTLHEGFPEVLAETRRLGFEAGVVTNGSRLLELAEALVSWASYVRVSIDGPTPAAHRSVHQSNDFAQITAGVAALTQLRARRNQRHPIIGLSFAMDAGLIELLPEAIQLGEQLAVDYVLLRPPFFEEVGRTPTMNARQAAAVRRRFEAARKAYQGSMKILVDHWVSDRDATEIDALNEPSPRRGCYQAAGSNGIEHVTGRCPASPLLAVIAADRSVYPCCNLRSLEEWSAGRIDYRQGVTFRQVWEGPRRRQLLARIGRFACRQHCTHPLSRYNEIIEYLMSERYHGSFL
jgi:MoaA/NifB/PqqE/SkfB family radical SAM enzyme